MFWYRVAKWAGAHRHEQARGLEARVEAVAAGAERLELVAAARRALAAAAADARIVVAAAEVAHREARGEVERAERVERPRRLDVLLHVRVRLAVHDAGRDRVARVLLVEHVVRGFQAAVRALHVPREHLLLVELLLLLNLHPR
jgi:hypothetical protein